MEGQIPLGSANGVIFGDGLRCVGGNVARLEVAFSSSRGAAETTLPVPSLGNAVAGVTSLYQYWYRDPTPGTCMSGFKLTNAIEVLDLPEAETLLRLTLAELYASQGDNERAFAHAKRALELSTSTRGIGKQERERAAQLHNRLARLH
ncbi:MAG: hypothetical protein ACI841_000774 [Planctomycetota bacterium]